MKMPTDIMKENDLTSLFKVSIINNKRNLSEIDTIRSIWIDASQENDTYLQNSSQICNLNYTPMESFLQEVKRYGFIIGHELENVKGRSRRSLMQQMSNHISMNFQSLYGKENSGCRQNYFQIGVRVPSKEHVSEIVGKQGLKIKDLREKTGALIITPGECEDHVFIIESTPEVALGVAKFIEERSNEISTSRVRDNFQKSLTINTGNRFGFNKSFTTMSKLKPILATGTIEVPKNIVGRIIGTHGSIITTIQKDTGTEIRSPPKDNHASNVTKKAKFEILVYQKLNSIDMQEALQRIKNAKQLIAHIAMHQMERIRAEESPFSNYRIKTFNNLDTKDDDKTFSGSGSLTDKEVLLNYQMQSVAWMWTDVDRLDEEVSNEIVSRILEESKKKSKLRPEYCNMDASKSDSERLDEIPANQQNPYTIGSSGCNGYHSSPFSPPWYSEITSKMNSVTTKPINGAPFDSCNLYSIPFINGSNSSSNNDLNITSRHILSNYQNLSTNDSDTSIKSYAEHLKAFTTGPTANSIAPGLARSTSRSHGAIGDHIKKLSPTETAQFNQI